MEIVKSNQMIPALRNKSPHADKMITPMRRIINRMPGMCYTLTRGWSLGGGMQKLYTYRT